ncbi:MAG TPA: type IV secretion system protein [Streptosporangiaceae bacterium]|nr:type IV secretion system protein [Streptosporangiaceae bacterium]
MIKPPDYPTAKMQTLPAQQLTYYDRYGTAGQSWYAVDMGCSDAMALMGNSVANTVFTLVRSIDRTTITVYESAASESLLGWLKKTVDGVISGIGKTFNARYWSWVVILGAMWMAWWGLVRRRASKATEGAIWMVAAMVGLIWLVARPADFTTLGTKVSDATSAAFNAALPQSSTAGAVCIPSPNGANPTTNPNTDVTSRNADGLWVALVCKPWLMGEFGTADPNAKIVKDNADKLLNAQAIDLPETYSGKQVDLSKKSDAYKAVANDVKTNYGGAYPVFQGKQWTSRLAVAFGGLFAALVAGLLVLVISIALIVVKISFLLLLVAGPIFLGFGIHPGIGRVIAIRWLELLLSMLLKQAALIGVLALLLWAYGLILGEGLPWGLQILLISLVTFAAFIYRKPFQHLFAAVGYSAVGSREKSDQHLEKSISEVRKNTIGAAGTIPGAGYRIARWTRPTAGSAEGGEAPTLAGSSAGTGVGDAGIRVSGIGTAGSGTPRSSGGAPPLNLPYGGAGTGRTSTSGGGLGTSRPVGAAPPRTAAGASSGGGSGTSKPASWAGGGAGAGRAAGGGSGGSGGSPGGSAGRSSGGSAGGSSAGSGGGRGWFGGSGSGAGSGGSGSGSGSGGGSAAGGGPSGDGGATSSGRGRSRGWFGGSGSGGGSGDSGGKPAAKRPAPPVKSGGGKDPAAGVPKPRGSSDQGGGGKPIAPPLWGRSASEEGPPIPFWLRPVDRDE